MMPSSNVVSRRSAGSGDGNVSDQFPAGLRVLVVDDDATCLKILEKMLKMCKYEVTKCNRAEVALSLLRENKNGFDVVISDVHMPDMDGFKLLVHIGLEMDLPVIMMSADDSKSVVMKGVTHGACDYLIKPVRIEALRNIWQHVVRKRKHEWKDLEQSASLDGGHNCKNTDEKQKQSEDPDNSSSANEGDNGKNTKRRKYDEDEAEERDDSSSIKKPRVVWSHELHQQFVAAVNQLGIDKAVPKKILDLMNVPGLSRENVASHLQKFRLYLRRLSETQQAGGINTSFMGNPDTSYRPISEHDFQALASSCQLPAESLATLEAMVLGRSGNPKSDISVDTRNTFSFENPKLRNEQVQNGPRNNINISKQVNFLHGIPTTMEPKQLVSLQRSFTGMSSQGFISVNGQSQSHTHASMQSVLPDAMADNLRQTVLPNGFVPSYGVSNNVNQRKPLDWGLQEVNLTFQPSQHTNYMQGGTNVLQQNFPTGQKITGGTNVFEHISQDKDEKAKYGTSHQLFCPEEYTQDDLLTVILTQQQLQQEAIQAENEFAFDWYSLDNLPA